MNDDDIWQAEQFRAIRSAVQKDGTLPAADSYPAAVRIALRERRRLRDLISRFPLSQPKGKHAQHDVSMIDGDGYCEDCHEALTRAEYNELRDYDLVSSFFSSLSPKPKAESRKPAMAERHRAAIGLLTDLDALTRRVREFLDEEVKR